MGSATRQRWMRAGWGAHPRFLLFAPPMQRTGPAVWSSTGSPTTRRTGRTRPITAMRERTRGKSPAARTAREKTRPQTDNRCAMRPAVHAANRFGKRPMPTSAMRAAGLAGDPAWSKAVCVKRPPGVDGGHQRMKSRLTRRKTSVPACRNHSKATISRETMSAHGCACVTTPVLCPHCAVNRRRP